MSKARELAETYSISLSDVKEPMKGETMEVREIKLFDSQYYFSRVLFWLQTYFDVKVLICTHTRLLTVYGYTTDIDLFEYFYYFTCKSCMNDLKAFRKTERYQEFLNRGVHGRTIGANFIKGYCVEVAAKLKSDYNERKEARTQTTALVLVEKEKAVN